MGRKHDATHARIVREASRLFRERGTEDVGVEEVMDAAGLTRGGFYAHFKSKDALVAEAVSLGFEDGKTNLFGIPENEGAPWLEHAARRYLAESHIDAVGDGCIVAALGPEMARRKGLARNAFDRGLAEVIDGVRVRLGKELGGQKPGRAPALFASWVGALQAARLVRNRTAAVELLNAARRASLNT